MKRTIAVPEGHEPIEVDLTQEEIDFIVNEQKLSDAETARQNIINQIIVLEESYTVRRQLEGDQQWISDLKSKIEELRKQL